MSKRANTERTEVESQTSPAELTPDQHIDTFTGDPNFMTSLARGLAVLSAFDEQHPVMNIAQLSVRTGIPRAAVRRCLYTLGRLGYVGEGPRFALRPKVLRLGHAQLTAATLAARVQPVLDRCRDQLHESCSLGRLDGDDLVYVARSERNRIMSIALQVGSRLPAYCTSMGRVLLSHLGEDELDAYLERITPSPLTPRTVVSKQRLREVIASVRRAQYAIVDQELEIGLRSIAVPVYDETGRVVAALNAGTPSARVPLRELTQRFLPELRTAADALRG
ncbi:MAG: IclR family transcriptional regulator C-terminal domain-containing protein [Polyangiales bacterium]